MRESIIRVNISPSPLHFSPVAQLLKHRVAMREVSGSDPVIYLIGIRGSKFGDKFSRSAHREIPQGSVFGPSMFNVFFNDLYLI